MNKELLSETDEEEDLKSEPVVTDELPKDEEGDEDRPAKETDEEGDEEQQASADPDREAIRQRRRQEKIDRKQKREQAMARDKLEMEFLRKRNDDLERRINGVEQQTQQSQISTIDSHLRKSIEDVRLADQVIAKAVTAGNGDDVVQAQRYRDQAIEKARQLAALKEQVTKQAEAQANRAPAPDPRVVSYAQEFAAENSWFDPEGKDKDSSVMLALDNALASEGYEPDTEEYWDELRHRAERRLPHRFKQTSEPRSERQTERQSERQSERKPRGGPVVGSGREYAPSSTRNEIYISPERKAALIEMGVWDDPVLRVKYAKRYAEYDKQKRT